MGKFALPISTAVTIHASAPLRALWRWMADVKACYLGFYTILLLSILYGV